MESCFGFLIQLLTFHPKRADVRPGVNNERFHLGLFCRRGTRYTLRGCCRGSGSWCNSSILMYGSVSRNLCLRMYSQKKSKNQRKHEGENNLFEGSHSSILIC